MSTTGHDRAHTRTGIPGVSAALGASNRASRLSLLWLFALMNYLYCDVLGLTDANILKDLINGTGPVTMTQGFLLGSAIVMEIPIAMVLLSIVLRASTSRWASIFAGAIMTFVQVASLFVGTPTMYYAFYSAIEIATTAFITWYAWTWHRADG